MSGIPATLPVVITWDWREQPPMERIATAVNNGLLMHVVKDTGGDCYAVVLSPGSMTPAEVQAAYDQDGEED